MWAVLVLVDVLRTSHCDIGDYISAFQTDVGIVTPTYDAPVDLPGAGPVGYFSLYSDAPALPICKSVFSLFLFHAPDFGMDLVLLAFAVSARELRLTVLPLEFLSCF